MPSAQSARRTIPRLAGLCVVSSLMVLFAHRAGNHEGPQCTLKADAPDLLIVLGLIPPPVLLRRTTQALVQRALRGMIFIDRSAVGIHLMIAQTECDLPFLTIDLDDLGRHFILQLEFFFKLGLLIETSLANMNQSFDSPV